MAPQNEYEKQFCLYFDDLKKLVQSTNELDKQRISHTLRLLLLDKNPLMQNANRRLQLTIEFTTVYRSPPMKPADYIVWSILDGLYPQHTRPNSPIIREKLHRFFRKTCS